MLLKKWEPFDEVEELLRTMDEFSKALASVFPTRETELAVSWTPSVEVYEKDDSLVIRAEVPGVSKKDLKVEIIDDTLRISGERKEKDEVKRENYYRSEIRYGSFCRTIPIPPNFDTSKVEATFKDGILTVTLPKREEAKPKTVEVKVK